MINKIIKESDLICIASIGKPKGLNGEFFINSFCFPQENIQKYNIFYMENNVASYFQMDYIKQQNSKFVAKFKGINNKDEIKIHTNTKLFIVKDLLPSLSSKEIYWHELKGMTVINKKNEILGKVSEIKNFSEDKAGDILIIKPSLDSIDKNLRNIPFSSKFKINKVNREIFVDWDKDWLI